MAGNACSNGGTCTNGVCQSGCAAELTLCCRLRVRLRALPNLYRAEWNASDSAGAQHATFANAGYTSGRVGQSFSFNGGAVGNVALPSSRATLGERLHHRVLAQQHQPGGREQRALEARGVLGREPVPGPRPAQRVRRRQPVPEVWTSDAYRGFSTAGVLVRDGQWHHAATVRQGGALSINVDGRAAGTNTISGSLADLTATPVYALGVGRCVPGAPGSNGTQDGTALLNGRLDEVGFYPCAMSASELSAQAQGLCT